MIKVNIENTKLKEADFKKAEKLIKKAHENITKENGKGAEWLGWKNWPKEYNKKEVSSIIEKNKFFNSKKIDTLVVIGIGGSYLGARAAIEFSKGIVNNSKKEVLFVGTNMSNDYINSIIKRLEKRKWAINIISKSGTTLEPAVSFRIFRELLEAKYGKKAKDFIVATTDANKGTLHDLALNKGYTMYTIPDNIGGRYSVTTPVGLFPMQFMGIDINEVLLGSKQAMEELSTENLKDNQAYKYATARYLLSNDAKNKKPVELYVNYNPKLIYISEWLKQLYGESEGKDDKGVFPASVTNSADLHSLGQFIQDGTKLLFETVLWVEKENTSLLVPKTATNDDNLNYIANKEVSWANEQAFKGVVKAHFEKGKIDNIIINIPDFKDKTLGYMIYFFFISTAASCYMLDVNPFNQPGVEVYKSYMKELLSK